MDISAYLLPDLAARERERERGQCDEANHPRLRDSDNPRQKTGDVLTTVQPRQTHSGAVDCAWKSYSK